MSFGNNPVKIQSKITSGLKNNFKSSFLNNAEITPKDIISFIIYLMQVVEKYKINGSIKKEIVISIIKQIVFDYRNNIEDIDSINNFMDTVLPSLIDTIVSLDKKQIYIRLENVLQNGCGCI